MSSVEDVLQHVDLLTITQLKELQIILIRRSPVKCIFINIIINVLIISVASSIKRVVSRNKAVIII